MKRLLLALLTIAALQAGAQQNGEEEVVLDAAEKRIVKASYRAERAVSIRGAEAGGWQLTAGAAIEAREIDLTLREVRGVVRFRADATRLDDLLARSERRRLSRAIR